MGPGASRREQREAGREHVRQGRREASSRSDLETVISGGVQWFEQLIRQTSLL